MEKKLGIKSYIEKEVKPKYENITTPTGEAEFILSTGLVSLDKAMGGGIPSGTVMELAGKTGVGKTSTAITIAAEAVKAGYQTVYFPFERYDKKFCRALGLDVDAENFSTMMSLCGETIFNWITQMIIDEKAQVFIIDSITAVQPKEVLEKKSKEDDLMKGPPIGAHSRLVSNFMKKVQAVLRYKPAIVIFTNQMSANIGTYGSSLQPTGGNAASHTADFIVMFRTSEGEQISKKKAGDGVESTLTLNKCRAMDGQRFASTSITFYHGKGPDKIRDILVCATNAGIVDKRGAWYCYGDQKWQGEKGLVDAVKNDDKLYEEIKQKVMNSKTTFLSDATTEVLDDATA
jgi:recombination protein RecA